MDQLAFQGLNGFRKAARFPAFLRGGLRFALPQVQGRSWEVMFSPRHKTTARSMIFSSSRTFPG